MQHIKKILVVFCVLRFAFCMQSQVNLVKNPSFEQLKGCPNNYFQADTAMYWGWLNNQCTSSGGGNADIFTSCCTNQSACGMPSNVLGYQKARTGNTYIGICAICSLTYPIGGNSRNYLKGALNSTLISGNNYCLTFYYSTANLDKVVVNQFGIYIDNGAISSYTCNESIPVTPQVQNNPSFFMTDTLNWVKIQGIYVATGNENTITIGNFADSISTQTQSFNSSGGDDPFYFIDDISIVPIDLAAYAGHDTSITQNDSAYIGRASEVGLDDDCVWYILGNTTAIDTIAGMWVKPSATTSYLVEQNICGTVSYDTVVVNVSPLGINKLSVNDKQLIVYPNPSSGELFISGSDLTEKKWNIEITDVTGRIVLQNKYAVTNGLVKLNTQLIDGVYFVRVITSSGFIKQQKVIITN
jgi:hypothetical protein